VRRAVKIYNWLGDDIYNPFPDSLASAIYAIPRYYVRYDSTIELLISVWCDSNVKTKVIIYSRPGCHLCEEAKEAMRAASCEGKYTLDEVNIENHPELLKRYKDDIPVITFNGAEAFRHRLTPEEFRKRILEN
jgi:glutaredoxin